VKIINKNPSTNTWNSSHVEDRESKFRGYEILVL